MRFEIVNSKCGPDRLAISPEPPVGENEFNAAVREMAKSEVLRPLRSLWMMVISSSTASNKAVL
jgi:hypothetical protein